MKDEKEVIAFENSLSISDVDYLLDNAPYRGYRDRELVMAVYQDWREAAETTAWELGTVDEQSERYFNFDAYADDLQEFESYIELPSGKVAYYSL